jgi:hypothetical protein
MAWGQRSTHLRTTATLGCRAELETVDGLLILQRSLAGNRPLRQLQSTAHTGHFEDRMKSLLAFALVLVASQANISAATRPECADYQKLRDIKSPEGVFPQPTIAFQGEVVAVAPNPADSTTALSQPILSPPLVGFKQKITFHVLKTLKGPYQVGDAVTLTVRVTTVCAGWGCVFPFKIGDVTFVLAPSSAPSFIQGCWIYEGVAMQSILSVPDVMSPQRRH